jgi:UDP-N-acetylmuramyl pentapeptide phosphotransferase/UDP-N-acetylglucosamine-1-phosphate transferase
VPASELLPLFLGFLAAALLAPPVLRALSHGRLEQENYRGVRLPFPAGTAIVAAAALALVPLSILHELLEVDVFHGDVRTVAIYVLGVAFLGLVDDVLAAEPRGWRGHGAAVLGGGISTGALKAGGSLGLALFALADHGYGAGEYVLAVLLLVLTTNLFNLLDLRPGRSFKVFAALGAALTIGDWNAGPLATLGLFAGPVLVLGLYDLRERAMLGDTGSNLIGGLAGLWLVLTLGTLAQGIALALVLALTIYGEFRSINSVVEGNPLLRQLDSLGRPA